MTSQPVSPAYDAVLIVAFGGPEGKQDVLPFLENVLRGRNVPRQRMLEVAEHYYRFGGVSPLNSQIRSLIEELRPELDRRDIRLPIYWGNRNWHPLLSDTLQAMRDDGIGRALAFVLSGYSSYSSCRQYLEDIARARNAAGSQAPCVDKVRVFYNHPAFIAAAAERLAEALHKWEPDDRQNVHIAFTAHSIPLAMAEQCDYEQQLQETCRLICQQLAVPTGQWQLVYQSRSGRPGDPWLEPDVVDHLRALHSRDIHDVVIAPVGFLSDHMEVLFDLDEEARQTCEELGLRMARAATVGTHPRFVEMVGELIEERFGGHSQRRAIGRFGPGHDVCPADCCPAPQA